MEEIPVISPVASQPWSMLLDPEAARLAVERLSKLDLHRRTCRPLDRRRSRTVNAELMQFDAAIEDEPLPDEYENLHEEAGDGVLPSDGSSPM